MIKIRKVKHTLTNPDYNFFPYILIHVGDLTFIKNALNALKELYDKHHLRSEASFWLQNIYFVHLLPSKNISKLHK